MSVNTPGPDPGDFDADTSFTPISSGIPSAEAPIDTLDPTFIPPGLELIGPTQYAPAGDGTTSGSADSQPFTTANPAAAMKSCDAILQDAIRLADQLRLKLDELKEAQAAGGEVVDEVLRERAARISDEWCAAVHDGLEAIGAAGPAPGTAGPIETGTDGALRVPILPVLDTPGGRVWQIAELRHQIISCLPRSACATLLRTSRLGFESAVMPLYQSEEVALCDLVIACDSAESYRRSSYVYSVSMVTMKISEIRDFIWLFGSGHRLERCEVWFDWNQLGATIEWSHSASNGDAPVEIIRYLDSKRSDIHRAALLAMVRRSDSVEWSAEVICEDQDPDFEQDRADWWTPALGRPDFIDDGQHLRRVHYRDCSLFVLKSVMDLPCWDRDSLWTRHCDVHIEHPPDLWDQVDLDRFIGEYHGCVETLRFDAPGWYHDLTELLESLSSNARRFAAFRQVHLDVPLCDVAMCTDATESDIIARLSTSRNGQDRASSCSVFTFVTSTSGVIKVVKLAYW